MQHTRRSLIFVRPAPAYYYPLHTISFILSPSYSPAHKNAKMFKSILQKQSLYGKVKLAFIFLFLLRASVLYSYAIRQFLEIFNAKSQQTRQREFQPMSTGSPAQ